MKISNTLKVILFTLLISKQAASQEFYEDGSMKLTTISTDNKYGYDDDHRKSIKVGKIANQQGYLKALRGPNGEMVQFRRLGSCCSFKSKTAAFGSGLLDKYEVFYKGLDKPVILYLNSYDFESPQCPVGFTFITPDKIEKPVIYPADSIVKVQFCNPDSKYSVNDMLMKEKVGQFPQPEMAPQFDTGIEELKKYFAERPLTDKRLKGSVFRVSIAFLVDCNGKAGNFLIATKGKGLIETFANQVLERVNKMPQSWKPATNNGSNVDCYQVLNFTVMDGQLDKVSYVSVK